MDSRDTSVLNMSTYSNGKTMTVRFPLLRSVQMKALLQMISDMRKSQKDLSKPATKTATKKPTTTGKVERNILEEKREKVRTQRNQAKMAKVQVKQY